MRRRTFLGAGIFWGGGSSVVANEGVKLSVDGFFENSTVDDTPYVQNLLDSFDAVNLPSDKIFCCKSPIIIRRSNAAIFGGCLVFDRRVTGSAAIKVLNNGVTIQNVRVINLSRFGTAVGGKTTGILVSGDDSSVLGCTVDGFQMGISVSPTGEYYRHKIHNNSVLNVVGSGGGPYDKKSISGEDRGDGITIWGASASVMGNVVTAMEGTDARCGIFFEALSSYNSNRSTLSDSFCSISGNVVSGPFRRSIDCEEVSNCVVSANVCSAGVWAVIQISKGTKNAVVTANSIRYSRGKDDYTGLAWSPWRCAINVYSLVSNIVISNNNIEVAGSGDGIFLNGLKGAESSNISVLGNSVEFSSSGAGVGVLCIYSDRVLIANNRINNSSGAIGGGVRVDFSKDVTISTNDISSSRVSGVQKSIAIEFKNIDGFSRVVDNNLLADIGFSSVNVRKVYLRGNNFSSCGTSMFVRDSGVAIAEDNFFPVGDRPVVDCVGIDGCRIIGGN